MTTGNAPSPPAIRTSEVEALTQLNNCIPVLEYLESRTRQDHDFEAYQAIAKVLDDARGILQTAGMLDYTKQSTGFIDFK